jgi:hypothetical protein
MENKINLPTVAELFSDDLENAYKNEQLNYLCSSEPKKEWVKVHPYITDYRYLPIDKVEFLLRKIFKVYSIEITGQGIAFNGVYVTVRVHYLNPATGQMSFHDGIGAVQLQTKKGTSPADLANINQGAISMAFPIAKTIAVKDACDHFGNIFGANLNRKDTIPFTIDDKLAPEIDPEIQEQFDLMTDLDGLIGYSEGLPKTATNTLAFRKAFNKRKQELMPRFV